MRYVLAGVGVLAALVFMAASAAMNWVFLKSLGKSELEGQIFGAFSVALDITKSLLPVFIGWALLAERRIYAAIAGVVFVLLFTFSLGTAIGFTALNRGAVVGGKDVIQARHAASVRDITKVEGELALVKAVRAEAVIVQALRGLEQDRKWTTSKSCTEATTQDSRAYCESYFTTKAELAAATERTRLDARLAELRREAAALQEAGAGQDKDPQASILARLTGVNVSTAAMALVMFVAVLVEVLAAFGLYLAIGWLPRAAKPARREEQTVEDVPTPERQPPIAPPVRDVPAIAANVVSLEDQEYWSAPVRRLRLSDQR